MGTLQLEEFSLEGLVKQGQIGHWLRRLRIQQKIAWGYGLSLGVALVGTGLGIVLADEQQRQADMMGRDALEELDLIVHLRVNLLQTLIHQKEMSRLLSQPGRRQEHVAEWQTYYRQFRQSWQEFQATEGGTEGQEDSEEKGEVEANNAFIDKYEGVPEAYIQTLDRLFARLSLPF